MVSDIDLQELAKLHGPDRAFLSLYLASKDDLPSVRDRIRRIRNLLDDPTEREHLDANVELLDEVLDGYDFHARSLCVFACWALDVARGYPIDVPVETELRIGTSPHLRPLAEIQDERERFAVVAADNDVARIFLVSAEGPEEEERVRGDVKNDVKKGGQSQKRYERRREHALMHYAKEVVEALEDLTSRVPVGRVVLLGSGEATVEIRDELTSELRDKLVERAEADLHDLDGLLEVATERFEEEERAEERALWRRIEEGYLAGERAAVGPGETLAAAAAGRVERLLVGRGSEPRATRCRDCGNPSAGTPETCPVCGSADVFAVDLVEELVELTERFGASVEFAEDVPGLAENGHVAAALRY